MKNSLRILEGIGFNCWCNFCASIPDQSGGWVEMDTLNAELAHYNGSLQYSHDYITPIRTTVVQFITIEDCMLFKLRFA